MGYVYSDGHTDFRCYTVNFYNKKVEFIEDFIGTSEEAIGYTPSVRLDRARISSKDVVFKVGPTWKLPEWIAEDKEMLTNFLRKYHAGDGGKSRKNELYSSYLELIQIKQAIERPLQKRCSTLFDKL